MSQSTRIRSCRVGLRTDKLSRERGIASFAYSCGAKMSTPIPMGCHTGVNFIGVWSWIENVFCTPSGWQIS
jgi:hypothetical protein